VVPGAPVPSSEFVKLVIELVMVPGRQDGAASGTLAEVVGSIPVMVLVDPFSALCPGGSHDCCADLHSEF
jgi:hypothetical protein